MSRRFEVEEGGVLSILQPGVLGAWCFCFFLEPGLRLIPFDPF